MKRLAIAAAVLLAAAPAAAQHQPHVPPPSPPPPHGHRPPPPPGVHGGPQGDHAHATRDDERAIMAVVDRMFAALAAKDSAALLAEVVPQGWATANDLGPRRMVRSASWTEFASHLPRIPGRPMERLVDPHVHVEGEIAMIWSRYEFELDGRFSHCGIDHFDLIRQDGRWKVLNLTWTQQYENCQGRRPGARPEPPHADPVPPRPPQHPPGERG